MLLLPFLRPFALACIFTACCSACSSGTGEGDTNVETGHNKVRPTTHEDGMTANGDSATAGLRRDTAAHRPTGKELYKAAAQAEDRNKDGLAD